MTDYFKGSILMEATNIHFCYGNQLILRDVNFCIRNIQRPDMQQGQVEPLIGRSGIGKTQLFKILSGLQKPQTGSVKINGNQIVKAGDMGVIFQNYYLFEWRTVYQSLMLAAKMNPLLKGTEQDAIEQYADNFDLKDALQKYPQQLSGGQRQRISILQQLIKGADFLLLDEPFSGLDVCMLDKVTRLLLSVSVSDERKTLIIVSHDIATSVAISDTVLVLGNEAGKEGATIKQSFDLIEMDLAWRKDIQLDPTFARLVNEIKAAL